MKSYDLDSSMVLLALRVASKKRRWWQRRYKYKPEKLSAGALERHNRNCQCTIDPVYCPIHGR